MKIKTERINAELARQISKIIAENIKDPRMGGALVSVTKVSTTPDLKYAKVYLSIYGKDEEEVTEAYHTVCRSATFIRNMLKDSVNMRLLPELKFLIDDSAEYGVKMDALIERMKREHPYSEQSED